MRQLMMLCATLLLVLLLMSRAREPRAWSWLTHLDSNQRPTPESETIDAANPLLLHEELPPGVFVGSAAVADPPSGGVSQNDGETQQSSSTPPPQVDATVFDGIRDRTRVIPQAAYFHLLDVARRVPPEDLEEQGRRNALTFAHFSAAPKRYRGQPALLRGHVRRMTEIRPIANREGFETLYEGWLFTDESLDNPYVIIVSRLPRDFPLGGNIVENVSFAGYFLKLWTYQAGDDEAEKKGTGTIRYAPLLIGHRVVWHPRPQPVTAGGAAHAVMIALVAGLIVALFLVTWYARRSALAIREMYASRANRPTPTEVQALGDAAAPSTEEYLATIERQSAENEAETDPRD